MLVGEGHIFGGLSFQMKGRKEKGKKKKWEALEQTGKGIQSA